MYIAKRRVGIQPIVSKHSSANLSRHSWMRCTLKIDEYLTMAFCWNCNIFEIVHLLDKIYKDGSITLICYGILRFTFFAPIFMLYLHFGKYTRKGFITFWEIAPVFKGIAWTTAIYSITIELFNVSLASLALLNIKSVLNGNEVWRYCKFVGASKNCWPAKSTAPFTASCTGNQTVSLSSVEYFFSDIRLHDKNINLSDITQTRIGWVVSVLFTWCVIYFLMLRGIKVFIKITTPIAKFFWFLLIASTLIIMLALRGKYGVPSTLNTDVTLIFKLKYWMFLFRTCIVNAVPGNLILLGSYLPRDASPTSIGFSIYGLKQLLILTILIWYTTSLWIIKENYNIFNFRCISITGLKLFYAVIPDNLTTLPISTFFLITWFFSLWLYGILSTLFTLNAVITSLTDKKLKLIKRKKSLTGIFCGLCFVFNIVLLNPSFNAWLKMFQKSIVKKIPFIIFLVFCITICIYSVQEISDDFYFICRKNLGKYWIHALDSLPLVVFFCFLYKINEFIEMFYFQWSSNVRAIAYGLISVFLIPAFFISLKVYFHYMKIGKVTKAFCPTALWGPPTKIEKVSRLKLNRLEEFHYNSTFQCKHNCLLNSEDLQQQIKFLTRTKYRIITYLQDKDKNVSSIDL